nr:hypothetical protein [Xanthomonas populi]
MSYAIVWFGRAARTRLRVPPHSVEAERGVLGGLLLAPEAFDHSTTSSLTTMSTGAIIA